MTSLAMATRMRLMARSVTCKPCVGTAAAAFPSTPGGPAKGGCGSCAPIVTTFCIALFSLVRGSCGGGFNRLRSAVLLLPVADGRANGILGQYRTVNLHRRQRQLFDNVSVLDGQGVVHSAALRSEE